MSEQRPTEDLSILGPLAGVLRRRWWVIAIVPLIACACAVLLAARQPAEFASTAKVLVSDQDLSAVVSGVPTEQPDPDRALATAIEIARLPVIQEQAELAAGPVEPKVRDGAEVSVDALTDSSSGLLSNVLAFTVTATDAGYAQRLSTELAEQFVVFRGDLSTREIRQAREDTGSRIADLRASGRDSGEVYDELVARFEQLGTLLTLGGSGARVLAEGDEAEKVGPQPVRNGAAGFILGLLAAIIGALGIDRLDWRVRSQDEIGEVLGLPVLGRLDNPAREAKRTGLVTLVRPNDPAAEAFRMLRTNLKFALGAIGGRSVVVTSAVEGEGKTSTCCNLGVVCAAAGMDVVLVDLDLRRPRAHTYLGIERAPGVSEVVAGEVALDVALRDIDNLSGAEGGRMRILTSGTRIPSPGEFAGSRAVAHMLAGLAAECDLLIVDAPPALAVGDALALGGSVDAFIVVARADRADRRSLADLRHELSRSDTPIAGLVLTSALAARKRYAYYEEDPTVAVPPRRPDGTPADIDSRERADLPYPG
jgi:capsular exopolysaccharide synthesis family protein